MPVLESATVMAGMTIISSALSIAASIKQLMTQRNISAETALDEYKSNADEETEVFLNDPSNIQLIENLSNSVISAPTLEMLKKRALACRDSYLVALEEALDNDSGADESAAINKGELCVCKTLRLIERHNKGTLPSDQTLKNLFDEFNCHKH